MNVGDVLQLLDIKTAQHFTEPPPRYSEASLVKALEEFALVVLPRMPASSRLCLQKIL